MSTRDLHERFLKRASQLARERPPRIETPRLSLVVLLPEEIRALIDGDTARASSLAGVTFPPDWPEDDARGGLPWHLGHLEADARHRPWRIRVVVERASGVVVGSINLKGPPDADGDVEIGWGISQPWRRRGYALEAVLAVIDWAAGQPGTTTLSATIDDANAASQRLAAKVGFSRTDRLRRQLPLWCRGALGPGESVEVREFKS